MDRSITAHLSKAETFESPTENDPAFRALDQFKNLESIVQQSLETPSAGAADEFAIPSPKFIQIQAPLARQASNGKSFSEAIRARAAARVQFSRSSIIKARRST